MANTKTAVSVMDPVCGQGLNPETAEYSAQYQDKLYYFCSRECKQKFLEDPEEYAGF